MNSLNQLGGFWRLWIVLSVLWIAGIYVEDNWEEISYWFSPSDDPLKDLPIADGWKGSEAEFRALFRRLISDAAKGLSDGDTRGLNFNEAKAAYSRALFLRALGPPIAVLVLAALARWIARGFKRDVS